MSESQLYVFVDESGLASRGECYVVVATWCVSERTDEQHVLSQTKDRCLELIEGCPAELKGASLAPSSIDTVVSSIESFACEDETVSRHHPAWADSIPLRYTLHTTQPTLMQNVTKTGPDAPEQIKSHSLGAVLDPLFRPGQLELCAFSGIRVVLDAETWQRVKRRFKTAIDSRSEEYLDSVSFAVADTVSVPGIQISDLAAYSWARNRRKGDCTAAVHEVDTLRFGEL